MISCRSCLSLGRSCQSKSSGFSRKEICQLYGVTYCVDVRIGGLEVLVDLYASGDTDLKACCLGQLSLRFHSDGHNYVISLDLKGLAVSFHYDAVFLDLLQHGADIELHSIIVHFLVEDLNHVIVKRLKYLIKTFHQSHFLSCFCKVLCHLDAYETSADDSGFSAPAEGHGVLYIYNVVYSSY